MTPFEKGGLRVRLAACKDDVAAAQALRHKAFFSRDGLDDDGFDGFCDQVLVERISDAALVGCFRMMRFEGGREIRRSYSAQFYELSALEDYEGAMVEMGRFCIDPEACDADILRVSWAAMTRYVDENNVEMLFGCSSFPGVETTPYLDAFAWLKARHLAPKRWLPRVKAPQVFRFASKLRRKPDPKRAMGRMPPLLKTYLMMGGWVSDHAVVDRKMGTLHVFTGVEIAAIPPSRKRLLRATAA